MFFYQALIMAVVIIAIYVLVFFLRSKKRKVLVISIIGLIAVGGIGIYAVQYYFGNHFYTQEIETGTIEGISLSSVQKRDIHKIFPDFKAINGVKLSTVALEKTYKVNGNGANSTIDADIYTFSTPKDADSYFKSSQTFYENKSFIPLDIKSKKKGIGELYLISYIKSQYKDYSDIIYLPSKISYSSDVVIKCDNVIFQINETANKPVTNKAAVINDIKNRLKQ